MRARTAEKFDPNNKGYIVLDDIRHKLHPSVLEKGCVNPQIYYMRRHGIGIGEDANQVEKKLKPKEELEALMKPLDKWAANSRCAKSLTHHLAVGKVPKDPATEALELA